MRIKLSKHFSLPGIVPAVLLSMMLLLSLGCEGPQGPQGEGVGDLDTTPPSISWVSPTRSDTTLSAQFEVRATASDNREVLYVQFFLDGAGSVDDTAAVDSSAPFTYTWDLTRLERSYGVYPIIARAFDPSKNYADTPPLLITYAPLPATQVLSYYGEGEFDAMHLPDRYTDKYFNVRFTPYGPCTVEEVRFRFDDPSNYTSYAPDSVPLTGLCDMNVFLWRTGENGLPQVSSADSMFVSQNDILTDDWTIIDVSGMDSVAYDGEFHAGFSPPSADYGSLLQQHRALPLMVQVDPTPLDNATEHRSSEYEQGSDARGWGTIQSQWNGEKRDFLIEVLVSYSNGTTAVLTPQNHNQETGANNE